MNPNPALKYTALALLLPFPCLAQAQWADKTTNIEFSAGYSATAGSTSNYLDGGLMVGAAVELSPALLKPFAFRFNLNYSRYDATIGYLDQASQALNQEVDTGTGSVLSGTANILYRIPIAYGIRAYGLAGIGAYYTRIELDQVLPFGAYGYGCGFGCGNGYGYGYGYDYGYDYGFAEAQVAAHGVTNFGWDAGVGVEFALPDRRSWFIEARYEHVNAQGPLSYVPIEVGFRF